MPASKTAAGIGGADSANRANGAAGANSADKARGARGSGAMPQAVGAKDPDANSVPKVRASKAHISERERELQLLRRPKAPQPWDLRLCPAMALCWGCAWALVQVDARSKQAWKFWLLLAVICALSGLVCISRHPRQPTHRLDKRAGAGQTHSHLWFSVGACLLSVCALSLSGAAQVYNRSRDPILDYIDAAQSLSQSQGQKQARAPSSSQGQRVSGNEAVAGAVGAAETITNATKAAGAGAVNLTAQVRSVPKPLTRPGRYLVNLKVMRVNARPSRALITLFASSAWSGVKPGETVSFQANLRGAKAGGRALAIASHNRLPHTLKPPGGVYRLVNAARRQLAGAARNANHAHPPPVPSVLARWGSTVDEGSGVGEGSAAGEGSVAGERNGEAEASAAAELGQLPLGADAPELVIGVVLGDDTGLEAATTKNMRASNLTHLTAVSGEHVALVLAATLTLCGPLPVRLKTLIGLFTLVGLVLLVQPSGSVLRAAAMGSVQLVGLSVGRQASALPAWAAGAIVLLLIDPWQACDWGFALSIAATGGLIMLAPGIERQLGRLMPTFFAQLAAIPLAAQLACGPLLIALNPHISMWGVVANMLAAPVVAVVTYTGLAATVLATALPSLAQLLVLPALWGCAWLECIAHFFAHLPGAQVNWPGKASGVCSLAALNAGIWLLLARMRR
jgi:ComEC/Rec2-like protein